MSNHSLGDLTQTDWIRACKKLGLLVNTCLGKGSHVRIENPTTGERFTIQYHLNKIINQKIFGVLSRWGLHEEDIWDAL